MCIRPYDVLTVDYFYVPFAAGKFEDNKIKWRGDSALDDGKDAKVDSALDSMVNCNDSCRLL